MGDGRGRVNRGGGGVINFLPLKRDGLLEGGDLFERRGCLIEELRYFISSMFLAYLHLNMLSFKRSMWVN